MFDLKTKKYQLWLVEYDGFGGVKVRSWKSVESRTIPALAKEITEYGQFHHVKYGFYITLEEVDEAGNAVDKGFSLRVFQMADKKIGAAKLKKYIENQLAKDKLLEGYK